MVNESTKRTELLYKLAPPWYHSRFDDFRSIFTNAPEKTYKKNEIIYVQGDMNHYIYFIVEGRVRMSLFDQAGNEKSVIILNPGSIFGENCALERQPALVTTTTNTPCRIAFIHRNDFLEKIFKDRNLNERLIYNLTGKLNAMIKHIKEISFMNANERIMTYLYKLSEVYGHDTDRGRKITIKFTHQEMADLSGISRVSVSNIMTLLDKAGTISKTDGYYYINNVEHLKEWIKEE
ncbi:Crp/Fnr family transcriptional regulator [Alteribacillus sp. YIM 98480]|uniref:Crp/Fnr family transcriptional regulator n=1 Tax=Alteribacillus sp. YIM 98480 TaxID=2606599 RepID=UPI00131B5562|nr:Crp/Fnr family transcriptional regulator [Alteribacillus sp. YIM 98480]